MLGAPRVSILAPDNPKNPKNLLHGIYPFATFRAPFLWNGRLVL